MKKGKIKKGSALQELQKVANEKGGFCTKCGKKTDYLTVDHIVPFSWVFDMGLRDISYDHDWNFQLLCRACNRLKAAKFDFTDPRTMVNLKKYIEIAEEFYKL